HLDDHVGEEAGRGAAARRSRDAFQLVGRDRRLTGGGAVVQIGDLRPIGWAVELALGRDPLIELDGAESSLAPDGRVRLARELHLDLRLCVRKLDLVDLGAFAVGVPLDRGAEIRAATGSGRVVAVDRDHGFAAGTRLAVAPE